MYKYDSVVIAGVTGKEVRAGNTVKARVALQF